MKSLLLVLAMVLAGCNVSPKVKVIPNNTEAAAAIDAAIRRTLNKPSGDLAQTDMEKVKGLYLGGNLIRDLSPLAKLTGVEGLSLPFNRSPT